MFIPGMLPGKKTVIGPDSGPDESKKGVLGVTNNPNNIHLDSEVIPIDEPNGLAGIDEDGVIKARVIHVHGSEQDVKDADLQKGELGLVYQDVVDDNGDPATFLKDIYCKRSAVVSGFHLDEIVPLSEGVRISDTEKTAIVTPSTADTTYFFDSIDPWKFVGNPVGYPVYPPNSVHRIPSFSRYVSAYPLPVDFNSWVSPNEWGFRRIVRPYVHSRPFEPMFEFYFQNWPWSNCTIFHDGTIFSGSSVYCKGGSNIVLGPSEIAKISPFKMVEGYAHTMKWYAEKWPE